MLRVFFSLLFLSLASGMMGCNSPHQICYHNSGICDCDQDEAPCTHRFPYAMPVMAPMPGTPVSPGSPLPAPMPVPKSMP